MLKDFFINDIGIKNRRDLVINVIELAVVLLAAIVFNFISSKLIFGKDSGYLGYLVWIAACYIIYVLYKMRKIAVKRMEVLFAVTALILGTFYIAVSPVTVGVSWDDQIHYGSAVLGISPLAGRKYYKADEDDIASAGEIGASFTVEQGKAGLTRDGREELSDRLNSEFKSGEDGANVISHLNFQAVAYIPSAIGIIIGRIIRLSWTGCFNLGRFFNLLAYVTIIAIAIYRLKSCKLTCALIGLIPSSIFMASSYSYDPWVIAWLILGFVEFFNMISDSEKKISTKSWMRMLLIFFIGLLPKMVYVVILLPLLFVSLERFENKKQAVILKSSVFIAALILAVSYAAPELYYGALLKGDTRGGDGVNPLGQVSFLIHEPGKAWKIITDFAVKYVGLNVGSTYFQKFAYLGDGNFEILTWVALALGIAMEEKKDTWCPRIIRISGLIGIALGVIVVILSLYVAFNVVGSKAVQGVQNRYIFPLLFPLFYYLKADSIKVKWDSEKLAVWPVAFMSLSFIYNIYALCVAFY